MIRAPRPRNPAIPGTTKDRTGTAGILRRAGAEIRRRWAGLEVDVLALFATIRTYQLNDSAPRTLYGITPDELAQVNAGLQDAVERWIARGRDPAHLFWWSPFDAEAQQLGTAQSASNLTNLSTAYAASRTLQQVVWSEPYRNRLAMAQLKSYEHWTGLGAEAKADLAGIIGRAVVDGKNPRAVVTEISDRLEVSRSRALGYAQTDITDTLRQARWAEADDAGASLGLRLGLLWTSALLPTTRHSHAVRHGQDYTTAQVREFYGKNGNRYRCHCSQTECLLDDDGVPMLSDGLKASMTKEITTWKKGRPA